MPEPFEDDDAQPGAGQQCRGDERIVSAADDRDVHP